MESILERTGMTTIRHLDFNWLNWKINLQTLISGYFSQVWPFWSEVTTPGSVNFTLRVSLHVCWSGLMDFFSEEIHQSGSVWTGQSWNIGILPSLLADTWTIPSWAYTSRLTRPCLLLSRLCCSSLQESGLSSLTPLYIWAKAELIANPWVTVSRVSCITRIVMTQTHTLFESSKETFLLQKKV